MASEESGSPRHSVRVRKTFDAVEVERNVYELAIERAKRAYELFDEVVVMFSGGKDSTAVLHVTIDAATELGKLPVRVVFLDEEIVDPETLAYVERVASWPEVKLDRYCLPYRFRNSSSRTESWYWCWDPDREDEWVRPMPEDAFNMQTHPHFDYPDGSNTTFYKLLIAEDRTRTIAAMMGIRAEESMIRHRAVTRRTEDNYIIPIESTYYKFYPVYDWKTVDVWTAPAQFGWDYSGAYDLMAAAGVSPHNQRVAPPVGQEALARLKIWPECWPELWDKMLIRFPDVGTALRYAKTDLYGKGQAGDMRPPEGMSWEEAIVYFIEKHPPVTRRFIKKRLSSFISSHKKRTDEPIPETGADPNSGLSWQYMLQYAVYGDTLSRKDPSMRVR